jgi:hypothetical protein
LLLQVNPDKWTDRLRTVPTTNKPDPVDDDDLGDSKGNNPRTKLQQQKKKEDPSGAAEGNWFSKLTSTASEVIKVILAIIYSRKPKSRANRRYIMVRRMVSKLSPTPAKMRNNEPKPQLKRSENVVSVVRNATKKFSDSKKRS